MYKKLGQCVRRLFGAGGYKSGRAGGRGAQSSPPPHAGRQAPGCRILPATSARPAAWHQPATMSGQRRGRWSGDVAGRGVGGGTPTLLARATTGAAAACAGARSLAAAATCACLTATTAGGVGASRGGRAAPGRVAIAPGGHCPRAGAPPRWNERLVGGAWGLGRPPHTGEACEERCSSSLQVHFACEPAPCAPPPPPRHPAAPLGPGDGVSRAHVARRPGRMASARRPAGQRAPQGQPRHEGTV